MINDTVEIHKITSIYIQQTYQFGHNTDRLYLENAIVTISITVEFHLALVYTHLYLSHVPQTGMWLWHQRLHLCLDARQQVPLDFKLW